MRHTTAIKPTTIQTNLILVGENKPIGCGMRRMKRSVISFWADLAHALNISDTFPMLVLTCVWRSHPCFITQKMKARSGLLKNYRHY